LTHYTQYTVKNKYISVRSYNGAEYNRLPDGQFLSVLGESLGPSGVAEASRELEESMGTTRHSRYSLPAKSIAIRFVRIDINDDIPEHLFIKKFPGFVNQGEES
jgi:hypothetical protein